MSSIRTRPKTVVFIRHAQSTRNDAKKGTTYFADEEARRLVRGIPDYKIPITQFGREQAIRTGPAVKERYGVPYYIYTSGYLRTEETMNGLLEAYTPEERARITHRSNHFLRERQAGYTYDMTEEEAEKHFPYLKEYWKTVGGFEGCPPGGQSLAHKAVECRLFLDHIFEARAGQTVFVVLHGGTLRCMRFLLEHWTLDQALAWPPGQEPENCGVTAYQVDESGQHLKLEAYNQVFWKDP